MLQPLLKCLGGKRRLAATIVDWLAPDPKRLGSYSEPFLGGGAVLSELWNRGARPELLELGDVPDLVEFYREVARSPEQLRTAMGELQREYEAAPKSVFKAWVVEFNANPKPRSKVAQLRRASIYWAIRKTCFRGVMRYNGSGMVNSPAGDAPCVPVPSGLLGAWSKVLRGATFSSSWRRALGSVGKVAAIYADPPYDGTFDGYSKAGFDSTERANLIHELFRRAAVGARVAYSDAATPIVEGEIARWSEEYGLPVEVRRIKVPVATTKIAGTRREELLVLIGGMIEP